MVAATGETAWKPVARLFRNKDKAILKLTLTHPDGKSETLGVTPEHPFNVVNEGWVEAGKLSVGAVIHSLDGQPIRVQSVEQDAQRQDAYNFEVADYHTYFVGQNGVWVHNVCGNVPKSTKNLTTSQKRSINSLTKRIDEHKKKLEDFKKNPDAFDNKGFLKNVPSDEIRQRIIDGRVRHLEKEIEDFQKGIDDILGG